MNTPLLPDIIEGVRGIYANTGGPMSRTRSERVKSSLLGSDDGVIRCPLRIRLGLRFVDTHPVNCLEVMLLAGGLRDPEELRSRYALPEGKLICVPRPDWEPRLEVSRFKRHEVLEQALMLGLCTAQLFDPDRPVLWTEASLTRSIELFDPRGFYA
jgi:hypothetical protein